MKNFRKNQNDKIYREKFNLSSPGLSSRALFTLLFIIFCLVPAGIYSIFVAGSLELLFLVSLLAAFGLLAFFIFIRKDYR